MIIIIIVIIIDTNREKVARDVITGKKIISLAITEPYGGSDVAAITLESLHARPDAGIPDLDCSIVRRRSELARVM